MRTNIEYFLYTIFNLLLFENALSEFFKTLQSLRPTCSLPGTHDHFKSLGLVFGKIDNM